MLPALIDILIVLVIAGVILWGVKQFPEIDATIQRIIRVLIIVVVVIVVLYFLVGLLGTLPALPGYRR